MAEDAAAMVAWNPLDWIGGYPYEYAKYEEVVQFYRDRGFVASKVIPTEGTGNHQFCFVSDATACSATIRMRSQRQSR